MAAFFAIEPGWLSHPKVQDINNNARMLWIAAGLHAVGSETDGRIEKRMLRYIAHQVNVSPKLADALVTAGLWIEHADHYAIHDFLKYNQSKALREAQREKWRKAKAKAAGLPEDSTSEPPKNPNGETSGIPRASLPCLALPTEKALIGSEVNPPRNGNSHTPPNQPTDEGRAEIAAVRARLARKGLVHKERT